MHIGGMGAALRAAILALAVTACGQPTGFGAVLDDAVDAGFPGVVLYVRAGTDTWVGARGVSDIVANTPLAVDDRMLLVRSAHPILAAAVLQLVTENKVRLDAAVAQYAGLDILYGVPDAQRITVQQALAHTSGLRDPYGLAAFQEEVLGRGADPRRVWTPKDVLGHLGRPGNRPTFPPGQGVRYSAANTLALALVLEAAGGESLDAALQRRVYARAAMVHTSAGGAVVPGYAVLPKAQVDAGVTSRAAPVGAFREVSSITAGFGGAGAGIATTAEDLALFLDALFEGRVVALEQMERMRNAATATTVLETGAEVRFGLGLAERITAGSGVVIGFEGAGYGYTTMVYRVPELDITVALLANASGRDLSLSDALEAVLRLAKASDKRAFGVR